MKYKVKPNPKCKVCKGTGEFSQMHEPWAFETLICDCITDQLPEDFSSTKDSFSIDLDFDQEENNIRQVKYALASDLLAGWTIDPKELDEILKSIQTEFPCLVIDKEDLEDILIALSKMNIVFLKQVEE